jgi:uncharacterized protein (TIGR03435 family)
MIAELTRHVWQSTFFAVAVGLLMLAFRRNRAHVRYWLWLSASVKFLAPFALLMNVGSHLTWSPAVQRIATPALSFAQEYVVQPFPDNSSFIPAASPGANWMPSILFGVWACGFLTIALIRFRSWLRIRVAVRASTATHIHAGVEVRVSPGLLEPGVVGLMRPILLLPKGITERLTPSELKAVLAHELCHVRRRDNLCAAIHMIVETAFWFHPFVWWIGARLLEERERACDEEVLSQGNAADVYADAILNVCKLYVESPLTCISGVSGASIRKRIEAIISNRRALSLNNAKKFLLASAGVMALVGPVVIGVGNAPAIHAQPRSSPHFEVASVKACPAGQDAGSRGVGGGRLIASSGRLYAECQSLATLIRFAYLSYQYAETESHRVVLQDFKGIPGWGTSDRYSIEATGMGTETREMILGPMLRTLLEDRFKLQIHRETKEIPVYDLTVAKGGPKLQPAREGSCVPRDPNGPLVMPGPGVARVCGLFYKSGTGEGRDSPGQTMAGLCRQLSAFLDRDVVDKTGLAGAFDIHLDLTSDDLSVSLANHTDSQISAIFAAMPSLGLKIESAKGSGEFVVVDHVERPSEN